MGSQKHFIDFRRLALEDAGALAEFYNALSGESKRLFRPLSEKTDKYRCIELANDNVADCKYDLVAVYEAVVVGWAFVWNVEEPHECTFGIGVSDDWQGRGIGKMLMAQVLDSCHQRGIIRVHLIVVQDNVRAQSLYKQMGFSVTGAEVGSDGQDYFKMVKSIEKGGNSQ